jgi:NAD(P)-dependent dehydrogenase (short-subunit alcohol dehydrogenase family)
MRLVDKSFVIIGGTSGIGLSAAKALAREGANLVLVGLDEQSCKDAYLALDGMAHVYCEDAQKEGVAQSAIEICIDIYGDFHGLYHVAGGSGRKFGDGPLHEMTLEGWNKTLSLNLTSMMLSNQAAVQAF